MTQLQVDERVAEAVSLRSDGRDEEALDILLDLVAQFPDDGLVNLQCAWTHDRLGLEREAVPYYEEAIRLGLPPQDLRGALLGLGSTYRALGRYDTAVEILDNGIAEFPEDNAIKTFRALALYNTGAAKTACEELLTLLLQTTADPSISSYRSALETYAADLDATW